MASKRNQGRSLMTLTGIAAGAAIGAALGLIYSPGTGEENRRRCLDWVNSRLTDAGSRAQDQATRASVWAEHRADEVRDKTQTVVTGVQEQVARVVPNATPAPDTGGSEC